MPNFVQILGRIGVWWPCNKGCFSTSQALHCSGSLRMVPLHNKINFSSQNLAKDFGPLCSKMGFYRKMALWPGQKQPVWKFYYANGPLGTFCCFKRKKNVVNFKVYLVTKNGTNCKSCSKLQRTSFFGGSPYFIPAFLHAFERKIFKGCKKIALAGARTWSEVDFLYKYNKNLDGCVILKKMKVSWYTIEAKAWWTCGTPVEPT